jgi:hypothetical protein
MYWPLARRQWTARRMRCEATMQQVVDPGERLGTPTHQMNRCVDAVRFLVVIHV